MNPMTKSRTPSDLASLATGTTESLRETLRCGDVEALRSHLQGPHRESFHIHITEIPRIVERGHVELIDFLIGLPVIYPDLVPRCGSWALRPNFFLRLALVDEREDTKDKGTKTLAEHLWHNKRVLESVISSREETWLLIFVLLLAWSPRNSRRLLELLAQYNNTPLPTFTSPEEENAWLAASLAPFSPETFEPYLQRIKGSHFMTLVRSMGDVPCLIPHRDT